MMDLFSQTERILITEKSLLESGFVHFQEEINRNLKQFVMTKGKLIVWKMKDGKIVYDNDLYVEVKYMDELPKDITTMVES